MPTNAELVAISVPVREAARTRSLRPRARVIEPLARCALAFAAGTATFAILGVVLPAAGAAAVAVAVAALVGELAAGAGRRAARSEVARGALIEEQAALRRVATLVAQGGPAADVFAAVAREVGRLVGADAAHIVRYEGNGMALAVAGWHAGGGHIRVGTRADIRGDNVARLVLQTRAPARIDDYADASGPVAELLRDVGIRSSVGCPVIVGGRLWGVVMASSKGERHLPAGTEDRIAPFTELAAIAISNAIADRLADEQAALRRVAMLVANNAGSTELFDTVTRECGGLLAADRCGLLRSEADGTMTTVAMWAAPLDAPGGASSVRSPIVLDGRVWGALIVEGTLGPDAESRASHFSDLVATALSNLHAREQARRLADEQAALRRVATLVARGAPASEIFCGACAELGRLLGVDDVRMVRYDGEDSVVVGSCGRLSDPPPAGMRCPILVEGRLWGAMIAASPRPEAMPADTASRMAEFTELVATAVSNLQARTELADSRARIMAATDEERRRVVRDLHDGAQQRLIHTVITLKLARRALERAEEAVPLVTEALQQAENATAELRELAHGILPAVLTRGGLPAGVEALASRMPIPVDLDVAVERLPTAVEATAYFVVAEALTNVAKHAHARAAAVSVRVERETLAVEVVDNGIGGALPDGTGLVGLADRVAAVAGDLIVETPLCGGTRVLATIPLLSS